MKTDYVCHQTYNLSILLACYYNSDSFLNIFYVRGFYVFYCKKITIILFLSCTLISLSFAGTEDWIGEFTIKISNAETQKVFHAPNQIRYQFFTVGQCLYLAKGTKINGHVIKENVNLCVNSPVEIFTGEVSKLGLITQKTIQLGPTYHS